MRNRAPGNATIVNEAGVGGAGGGFTTFNESQAGTASAGNSVIINNSSSVSGVGGGGTTFGYTSSAANATLVANGGTNGGDGGLIAFSFKAKGGTARIELFGNGSLDIAFL